MVESREEVRDRLGLRGGRPPIRKDRLEAGHDGLGPRFVVVLVIVSSRVP